MEGQYNMVKVLWVENDPVVLNAYPLEAEDYGVELVPFTCWDDAEIELRKNYHKWGAIVLDAKCKVHKDSMDKAVPFLIAAFQSLARLATENKTRIPWFVLSGGDEEEINDCIPEDRELWDLGRKTKYYQKASSQDRIELWKRIPLIAEEMSDVVKLKTGLFQQVFMALRDCDLDPLAEDCLTVLLLPFACGRTDSQKYNNQYFYARQVIEYLFRSMLKYKIIPEVLVPDGKVNLTWTCRFLNAQNFGEYSVRLVDPIMTSTMSRNLLNMVYVTGSMVHTENPEKKTFPYLIDVSNSTFLLQSIALQLCDVFLWYSKYLRTHDDDEINALNWEITKIEITETVKEKDEASSACSGELN